MEQFPLFLFRICGSYENPLFTDMDTITYSSENKLYQYILEDDILAKTYIEQDDDARTYPPEATITYMQEAYVSLHHEQIAIETTNNKIRILILHIDNHHDYDFIVKDMRQCGYFISKTIRFIENLKPWVVYVFDPYIPQNLFNETKQFNYLHLINEKYIENVEKFGLRPKHDDNRFKYPKRIYLFTANESFSTLKQFARDYGLI